MTTDIMINRQVLGSHIAGDLPFPAPFLPHGAKNDELDEHSLRRLATLALNVLRETQSALEAANVKLADQAKQITALENLAATDMLTGLTNRRGFYEAFERELDRARRNQAKGGLLIMIDLDNFKTINDTYGHAAGDEALKLVAKTLGGAVRKMDLAGRLGGDEFVLLFSNADLLGAVDRAQQLAMRLNSLTLRYRGEKIPVRASIGMKAYKSGDSVESVFAAADEKMYAVKASNRKAATSAATVNGVEKEKARA